MPCSICSHRLVQINLIFLHQGELLLDDTLSLVSSTSCRAIRILRSSLGDQILGMLWLGDHLVVDVVNVSLDRDVLGLSSDLYVGACCTDTSGSGALIVVSIVLSCLKLL